jgi:hypothetical protein
MNNTKLITSLMGENKGEEGFVSNKIEFMIRPRPERRKT